MNEGLTGEALEEAQAKDKKRKTDYQKKKAQLEKTSKAFFSKEKADADRVTQLAREAIEIQNQVEKLRSVSV